MRRLPTLMVFFACVALPSFAADEPGGASASTASPAMSAPLPTNYADRRNWLCWPGRSPDACVVDLTTTIVESDGHIRVEKFRPASKPPIDCFYVYPTVSTDAGLYSTLAVEPEERLAVMTQFARFGGRCRLFAPMYRQLTLAGLRAALSGHPMAGADVSAIRDVGYNDVKSAWEYYLKHENHGRGVVLIGHSQGSIMLLDLIKSEIDGKPSQSLLVSAMLLGWNLVVPKGADVGGDFKSIPLCHRSSQTGCAIAFVSFRDTAPPPAGSMFGHPQTPEPGMVAACVNPAALAGGAGELKAYLGSGTLLLAGNVAEPTRWAKDVTVTTPFVSVPGLLSAHCVETEQFNYLSVTVNADPRGPRTDHIPGDLVKGGVIRTDWGLHLIDANLVMGNLLDIVGAESTAWAAKKP
jgi:hypothetical protein